MNEQTTLPAEQRRPESALDPLGRLRDEIDRLFERPVHARRISLLLGAGPIYLSRDDVRQLKSTCCN